MNKDEIVQLVNGNFARRADYLSKNKIEAYRLIENTNRMLPIAVDVYKDNAVVHLFGHVDNETIGALESTLIGELKIKYFFYKNRTKTNMKLPESPKKEITVEEYGHKFSINLSDYLDTGLFLDHRETRRWIAGLSKGKSILNTFAYTGSFSIYAARAGATRTHTVDLSKTYCEWTKKNLALNNLPPETNWVYKMDTMEYFKYAKRKGLSFDIIIIDPPTFSRNKGKSFSVQKDHPALINAALEILTPSGLILFSNNFTEFRLQKNKLNKCFAQEKKGTAPIDFEQNSLHKCFVISKK